MDGYKKGQFKRESWGRGIILAKRDIWLIEPRDHHYVIEDDRLDTTHKPPISHIT